jgi:hypothetical protein
MGSNDEIKSFTKTDNINALKDRKDSKKLNIILNIRELRKGPV